MAVSRLIFRGAVAAAATVVVFCVTGSQGRAEQIDPRCRTMTDPLGCTCALQNGGRIIHDSRVHWASAHDTNRGRPTNQAFTDCLIRHGRR